MEKTNEQERRPDEGTPSDDGRTGEDQAEINRENDPPA